MSADCKLNVNIDGWYSAVRGTRIHSEMFIVSAKVDSCCILLRGVRRTHRDYPGKTLRQIVLLAITKCHCCDDLEHVNSGPQIKVFCNRCWRTCLQCEEYQECRAEGFDHLCLQKANRLLVSMLRLKPTPVYVQVVYC